MVSGEEAGSLRLSFADAQELQLTPVAEFSTQQTSSAAKGYPADRDSMALPLMPSTNLWVNEQARIVLSFQSDAADTLESEESNGFIPIILKNKSTGFIQHLKLRIGDDGTSDFSGFDSTNDVAVITTSYRRLGAYTVPAGFMATLDAGQPVHAYFGDDTA